MGTSTRSVDMVVNGTSIVGDLTEPAHPIGVVLFAHGSGSSRNSPRNRYVAGVLQDGRLATFLVDLLSEEEGIADQQGARNRFDVELLAGRLVKAMEFLRSDAALAELPVSLFGASTGAAAALVAAARHPRWVSSIVSRGGRALLAGNALEQVRCPTLFIVGGADLATLEENEGAMTQMRCETTLVVIPAAGHLFAEPGALEEVARVACDWFEKYAIQDEASRAAD